MPLSNAERQKRYRERLKKENAEKYEEIRKKNLENVKSKKINISQLTEEERQRRREQWRKANHQRALKKKGYITESTTTSNVSSGDSNVAFHYQERNILEETKTENQQLKRNIQNLKRQLRRYKSEIKILNQKITLHSQIHSISENTSIIESVQYAEYTPNTKTEQFLGQIHTVSEGDKEKIKRNLLFMNTLTDSLKREYKNADTNEKKKVLKKVALCKTAEKYKLKTKISKSLGLKRLARSMKAKNVIRGKHKKDIEKFFKRDDVSRSTAGKQECVTKNKEKKQKRYMLDTMQKLHAKYKQEGGKASYVTFTRYRPFYVLTPKLQDRNTCACIKHANFSFKLLKLNKLGVLEASNIDDLMQSLACRESFDCMYAKCNDCSKKTPEINIDIDKKSPIQWLEWRMKTHKYSIINKNEKEEKTTKKYIKEIIDGTVETLINDFLRDIKLFKIHYYNVKHQHKAFRKCIENLQTDEVAVVCDFSENYACKQAEEIQAIHFGASRNQISLHTCVLYQKKDKPMSICSISPINEHGPGAIWAHLDPILKYIKSKNTIKKIHIFSDGPSTQYHQKNNFYLFTKRLTDYAFEEGTWNYFEASHGKGPADGVGGAIKRKLDQHVAHGHDITNAEEAYSFLRDNTKVSVYYVSQNDIHEITQMIPDNVIALKGTMKLHQIIYNCQNTHNIAYRLLSCICEEVGTCSCGEGIKHHDLLPLRLPIIMTSTRHTERETNNNEKQKTIRSDDETQNIIREIEEIQNIKWYNQETSDIKLNNKESQYINHNKEEINRKDIAVKKKVTVLSSVRLQDQNQPFSGLEMLPLELQLKPRNLCFDIFAGQDLQDKQQVIASKIRKRAKKLVNTGKENKKIKKSKNSNLTTLSDSSTSVDSDIISLYNSEILSDEDSDLDKPEAYGTTVVELHSPNKINIQIDKENMAFQNFNEEQATEVKQKKNSEKETKLKPYKKQLEKTNVLENYQQEQSQDDDEIFQIDIIKEAKNIDNLTNTNVDDSTKFIGSEESSKVIVEHEELFYVGASVLVRYYLKKSWKYFIGVIKNINHNTKMFTIIFYKTIGKNDTLKFTTPKRKDEDTVPYLSLVKVVELREIKENPKQFILINDEDKIYFH